MMPPVDLALARLAAQRFASPGLAPADVVRRLGAVQSQDFEGGKWAIGLRARGLRDADVERAFAAGEIVRTHVLRPTWHFVAPEDLRWMLALTGPRVKAAMAGYDRRLGLDDAVYRKSTNAIVRALEGGVQLTRTELAAELRRAGIDTTGTQRLAHLVMRAELDAVICSGARRGRHSTYALVDERVPQTPPRERDEALAELAARYFPFRGPATQHDFAWWSGLTVRDATRAIDAAGAALERFESDGRAYWRDAASRPRRPKSPNVLLLPNYDEYFIGFRNRGAFGRRLGSVQSVTGGDALIAHVVVADGQLVGGWRRAVGADTVVVRMQLLARLTSAERRAFDAAVARYGEFLGVPVEVDEHATSVVRERKLARARTGTVSTRQ